MSRAAHILPKAVPFGAAVLMLSACAPTVETHIMSGGAAPLTEMAEYVFINPPGNTSPLQITAKNLVADSLHLKNWKESATGKYAVSVTVSVFPSDLDVYENRAGQGPGKAIIEKREKKSGGCTAMRHRLDIKVFRVADGENMFTGGASEYHCKADISETLPFLTNAAMSNFGKPLQSIVEKR